MHPHCGCLQLEAAEREKQHMQQRLQQQPQNGISQLKMQELNKQVGADYCSAAFLQLCTCVPVQLVHAGQGKHHKQW
jgi:hypothetical protein